MAPMPLLSKIDVARLSINVLRDVMRQLTANTLQTSNIQIVNGVLVPPTTRGPLRAKALPLELSVVSPDDYGNRAGSRKRAAAATKANTTKPTDIRYTTSRPTAQIPKASFG